jgi:hypothetical protein
VLPAAAAVGMPILVLAASPAATSSYVYSANADAAAVEVVFSEPGVSTVPLVDARYPHAQADLGSPALSRARASVLDPGALVETIPSQVRNPPCSNGQCPPGFSGFPDYPFIATAAYPSQPNHDGSVAAQTLGPLAVGAGTFSAAAQAAASSAESHGDSLRINADAVVVGHGGALASTVGDALQTAGRAESRLSGIELFGVVRIESLVATAQSLAPSGGAARSSGTLSLSGVTVLGRAAAIDQAGVHLVGQGTSLSPIVSPAQQALDNLQQAGVVIRLLPVSRVDDATRSTYEGQALLVQATTPGGPGFAAQLGHLDLATFRVAEQVVPSGPPPAAGTVDAVQVIPGSATTSGTPGTPPVAGRRHPARQPSALDTALSALSLAPPALLFGLFAAFEAAMLTAVAALLWTRPSPPPHETLAPL